MKQILVLGEADDLHAEHIYTHLQQQGVDVAYFNSLLFPTQIQIAWYPHDRDGEIVLDTGKRYQLSQIQSVYWRSFNGVYSPPLSDSHQQSIAYNDAMSLLRTLFQVPTIRWVNGWQAYEFHKEKPRQLAVVKALGVTIPATLISNHATLITEFVTQHSQVIFKPVYGGSHAKLFTPEYLEPERLQLALKISPITLQEFISGTNIRTYAIGEQVYSAEIRTGEVDFREDSDAQLIPLEVPPTIASQSIAIARSLLLEWTAIDWRRTEDGTYYFLEANPSPMFIYFEKQTGYPITQELTNLVKYSNPLHSLTV
jgi:glutathione synthase/RimK-type ligase-like ATP-grasp enzyme